MTNMRQSYLFSVCLYSEELSKLVTTRNKFTPYYKHFIEFSCENQVLSFASDPDNVLSDYRTLSKM
jgi:hypothetical protein